MTFCLLYYLRIKSLETGRPKERWRQSTRAAIFDNTQHLHVCRDMWDPSLPFMLTQCIEWKQNIAQLEYPRIIKLSNRLWDDTLRNGDDPHYCFRYWFRWSMWFNILSLLSFDFMFVCYYICFMFCKKRNWSED